MTNAEYDAMTLAVETLNWNYGRGNVTCVCPDHFPKEGVYTGYAEYKTPYAGSGRFTFKATFFDTPKGTKVRVKARGHTKTLLVGPEEEPPA